MTDHVYRKFPNHIDAIQVLWQKDATFREICADYEEMRTWLDRQPRTGDRSTSECDRARELVQDLEDDIKTALRDAGFESP